MLREIPTSVYPLKMLRPGADVSLPPWLRYCLQDRITSLLQVMHTAKYIQVEPCYENCHIGITSKNNT